MDIVEYNTDMKNLVKNLICTLLLMSCTSTKGKEIDIYKIYYIPFDVNFYVPMLMSNIEENAHKKIEVKSKVISTFFSDLESKCKDKYFNERLDIRVKIKNSEKELYISRDQIFVYNGSACEISLEVKKEFTSYLVELVKR